MKCQYEKVMKYKDCQDCKLKENCIEYYQSVLERVMGIEEIVELLKTWLKEDGILEEGADMIKWLISDKIDGR